MNLSVSKSRVRYIDAMRAFAIWMVVYEHTITFGIYIPTEQTTPWHNTFLYWFFMSFFMPLFFMVSGLVGYKAVQNWSRRLYTRQVLHRAVQLLIPTIVFFCLLKWSQGINPWRYFCLKGLAEYWFTYVLFLYLLIYYTVSIIVKACRGGERICTWLMLALGAFTSVFIYSYFQYRDISFTKLNFLHYFLYFSLGLFLRYYFPKFKELLHSNTLITVAIIVAVTCCYLYYNVDTHNQDYLYLYLFRLSYFFALPLSLLYITFVAFQRGEGWFERRGVVQDAIALTGRRTLDIYMLQYFFLPFIPGLLPLINGSANPLLELLIIGTLAIANIALCLGVSQLIRLSPTLSHLLLATPKPYNRKP